MTVDELCDGLIEELEGPTGDDGLELAQVNTQIIFNIVAGIHEKGKDWGWW